MSNNPRSIAPLAAIIWLASVTTAMAQALPPPAPGGSAPPPPPPPVAAMPDPAPDAIGDDDIYTLTTNFQRLQWLRNRQAALAEKTKQLCATQFGPPSICARYIPDPKPSDGRNMPVVQVPIPQPPPPGPVRINPGLQPADTTALGDPNSYRLEGIIGPPGAYEADFLIPGNRPKTVRVGSPLGNGFVVVQITANSVVTVNQTSKQRKIYRQDAQAEQ